MNIRDIDFKDGLVPVVAQDLRGRVLMHAYANEEALGRTMDTGKAWYWSRSRNRLWMKGEESGNIQEVLGVFTDCDRDSLLYVVRQKGNACHTGSYSCFETVVSGDSQGSTRIPEHVMEEVYRIITERKRNRPEGSYVSGIIDDDARLVAKIREESHELIDAFNGEGDLVWEAADLIFHSLLLLANRGVEWTELTDEFERRRK
ncbi:MAG: hypothetical protein AYK23_04395 [Candidatus Proteinoplasmatales archaeon SG8-5]|nr:MAG: hypothetical protein AYK23_04395 [Candidatus Proteinoplasmatales archaeon SG8-5]